jgi:hypothetical protein
VSAPETGPGSCLKAPALSKKYDFFLLKYLGLEPDLRNRGRLETVVQYEELVGCRLFLGCGGLVELDRVKEY